MNTYMRKLINWSYGLGFDPFTFQRSIKGFPAVVREYQLFKRSGSIKGFPIEFSFPCPADRYETAGTASGHYFHQDLLVAQRIFERDPEEHVDVGSRIDGLIAHIAAFRKVKVLDIRPLDRRIRNIDFHKFDLMNPEDEFFSITDSLSCLHTLEHLGLGRYGDQIMVDGHVRGLYALWSLLKPGGILYLSVPIGRQRIEFNAHRIFSIRTILDMIEDKFDVIDFSYIDDRGDLHESVGLSENTVDISNILWYGCGIFEFRKRSRQIGNR